MYFFLFFDFELVTRSRRKQKGTALCLSLRGVIDKSSLCNPFFYNIE